MNCHLPRTKVLPSLFLKMRVWQVVACFVLMLSTLRAEEGGGAFAWKAPKVVASLYTRELGMLDSEREDYATNLAVYAANQVAASKAALASLDEAYRVIALALQLSPRNKRALVLSFQLSKGVLPEATSGNYSPQGLARLMLTRGQLLAKQGGEENKHLARYFIQLAAEMDPKNEDAVYASELQRLDHGALDWSSITQPPEPKPEVEPEVEPEP